MANTVSIWLVCDACGVGLCCGEGGPQFCCGEGGVEFCCGEGGVEFCCGGNGEELVSTTPLADSVGCAISVKAFSISKIVDYMFAL